MLYIIITRKIRATTFPSYAKNWRLLFTDNEGSRCGVNQLQGGLRVPPSFSAEINVSVDFTLGKGLGRTCGWMLVYWGVVKSHTAQMGA